MTVLRFPALCAALVVVTATSVAQTESTIGHLPCGDATTITYNDYTYTLVAIGEQCWFAENLRTAVYTNGDAIPGNLNDSAWSQTKSGAQAVYDFAKANLDAYGRLYNWYALDDARGLCPSGWHVPSDGEWIDMTNHLGGKSIAGRQMKSSNLDSPSWDGLNTSGFSGLPGGIRKHNGYFDYLGYSGGWWTSSPFYTSAWGRTLMPSVWYISRANDVLNQGRSVRCVRG